MNIGADGMKTGFTEDGGYGLVGSAVQNGLRLIVVVNGLKSAKDRANEGKRLLEWGFKGFESRYLFAEGQNIGDAKLFGGGPGQRSADGGRRRQPAGAARVERKASLARIVYSGPVRAPVEKGQPIGVAAGFGAATMSCSRCRCRPPKASRWAA